MSSDRLLGDSARVASLTTTSQKRSIPDRGASCVGAKAPTLGRHKDMLPRTPRMRHGQRMRGKGNLYFTRALVVGASERRMIGGMAAE